MTGLKGKERVVGEYAKANDVKRLSRSLDGVSDDCKGRALCWAARLGNKEAVEVLLAAGADPNYGNGAVIRTAAKAGQLETVRAVLEAGASIDGAALAYAVVNKQRELATYLESKGAVLDAKRHVSRVHAFE